MRRPSLSLVFAALLYGAMALAANGAGALTPDQRARLKELRAGDMSKFVVHEEARPPIETTFRDRAGNEVAVADYAGKVVLLNVWATWCPPCREEMPALDSLAGALEGPDLEVIALSTDRTGIGRVEEFYASTGVRNLEAMIDPKGAFMRAAGIMGLPVTLILDREGREIARMIGEADWDSPEARELIEAVVGMTRPEPAGSGA